MSKEQQKNTVDCSDCSIDRHPIPPIVDSVVSSSSSSCSSSSCCSNERKVEKASIKENAGDFTIGTITKSWNDFKQTLIEREGENVDFLRMFRDNDDDRLKSDQQPSADPFAASSASVADSSSVSVTMATQVIRTECCVYRAYFHDLRNHRIFIPNNIDYVIDNLKAERLTIIHFAVRARNILAVRLSLQYNVDINAVDVNGETALHKACHLMCSDIIELLLRNGATFMAIFDQTDDDQCDDNSDNNNNIHNNCDDGHRHRPADQHHPHQGSAAGIGKTLTSSNVGHRQKLESNRSNKGGNGRRVIYTLL